MEYFRRYPDRVGKDVFLQVAVVNRRSVDTYREYQVGGAVHFGTARPEWRVCRTSASAWWTR